MLELFEKVTVKGVSHITGGGFYENVPRSIPKGLGARIEKAAVPVLPIFRLIQQREISPSGICSTPLIWVSAWRQLWTKTMQQPH